MYISVSNIYLVSIYNWINSNIIILILRLTVDIYQICISINTILCVKVIVYYISVKCNTKEVYNDFFC